MEENNNFEAENIDVEQYENVTEQAEIIEPEPIVTRDNAENDYQDKESANTQYERYSDNSRSASNSNMGQELGNDNIVYAVLSLICGIVSLVCCCVIWVSLFAGIAAIVFGIITLKNGYAGRSLAIAGIITGGIAVVLMIFGLLIWGIGSMLGNITNRVLFRFNDHYFDNFNNLDDFKVFF